MVFAVLLPSNVVALWLYPETMQIQLLVCDGIAGTPM